MKKVLISALVIIVLGGAGFYAYRANQERKFIDAFGASKEELRAKLIANSLNLSVYFKRATREDEALKLTELLKKQPWVESAVFISSAEALAEFKNKHANDPTINQALRELEINPLLAATQVYLTDCSQKGIADEFMQGDIFKKAVERVTAPGIGCDDIDRRIEMLQKTF